MRTAALFTFLIIPWIFTMAQNDSIAELITDRPDATESSSTVPKNTLQIEMGFIRDQMSSSEFEINTIGIATTLLRYGVWDNFELRLGSFYGSSNETYNISENDTSYNGMGAIVSRI